MALKVGDKAPDFTLPSFTPSAELEQISLGNFKGKNLVIAFFPQAFTGVCTTEMCSMNDDFNAYKGMNTEVIGVSVDGTFVQKAFAKANNINVPLLSDFNRVMIRNYDVVHPEFAHGQKETAKRAVYVIDKDGLVRYVEVTPTPGDQLNFDAIKAAVAAL